MDRTNIIDDDEVARAMAATSRGKGKGKTKKKVTEAHTSNPPKSKKTTTVPAMRARSKTTGSPTSPTAAIPSAPRFYQANGLKIPLYNRNGLGKKKRPNARLSKTLLKHNTDELLDIVGQYAGAAKRQELKNKGLSKLMLANWIEEKETLALGRNPNSTLSFSEEEEGGEEEEVESGDGVASFLAPTIATSSSLKTKNPTATASATNDQGDDSPIAAKGNGGSNRISGRKRSAPDMTPGGQPTAKLQKRDEPANPVATYTERPPKEDSTDKSTDEVIRTLSQTDRQTSAYNDRDHEIYRQNAFFNSTGMNSSDPDRSSIIIWGDGEDLVLTATSHPTFRGPVTFLYETTIPHEATKPTKSSESSSVPYLKEGLHGRHGYFQADDDRRTGVGHQIEPDDHLKWGEFKDFRSMLYQQFPHYPEPVNGVSIDPKMKDAWNQWQWWYAEFRNKYPGYAVSHLWPCGCEMVGDGDESEEE